MQQGRNDAKIKNMKALYRRYRPKKLDEVVAQPQVTKPLISSLKSGKIGHAYLFVGPRGCGKTSVARILAHEINQFDYELEDNYLDIIEIDAASNTSVENIRDLRERAIVAPVEGKHKIYIIDEVHMLSKSAFNALLKTLEEPPEHVIFVLATTELQKVPATIVSRCQKFQFKLADPSEMFEYIKKICKTEKINIEDEALKVIISRGGGSFRDTLSLLDQISTISEAKKITEDNVREILGLPSEQVIQKLIAAYRTQDLNAIKDECFKLRENNIETKYIAELLITTIIDTMDVELLPLIEPLSTVSSSPFPEIKLLTSLINTQALAIQQPVVVPKISTTSVTESKPVAKVEESTKTPGPISLHTEGESRIATKPTKAPEPKQETPKSDQKGSKPEPKQEAPKPNTKKAEKNEEESTPPANTSFSSPEELWQNILNHVAQNAPTINKPLSDSEYKLEGTHLTIYANGGFHKKQLDGKLAIISAACPPEIDIEISADSLRSDDTMANIAELMGGGQEISIEE